MSKGLSMLIKPASGSCNMKCIYCFYLDSEVDFKTHSKGIMTTETAEVLVRRAFENNNEYCSFAFQGGEPTLVGLDFFKTFVALEKQYNVNNIPVFWTLQTNGLLINEEWAKFLHENEFLVGLSIDGPQEVHGKLRLDNGDRDTFPRVMETAKLFEKFQVEFNVLTVVTETLARNPKAAYQFYKEHGFKFIQFIPCLDDIGEAHGLYDYSLQPATYGVFLKEIFNYWYEDFIAGNYISIRAFDNYVQMLMGNQPDSCAMNGRCVSYPVIEADGSVYPCDFYVAKDYLLGTVFEQSFQEMLRSETSKQFMEESYELHPDCKNCEYLSICRGACRREREPMSGQAASISYYCQGYKIFFKQSLPRMIEIAENIKANTAQ